MRGEAVAQSRRLTVSSEIKVHTRGKGALRNPGSSKLKAREGRSPGCRVAACATGRALSQGPDLGQQAPPFPVHPNMPLLLTDRPHYHLFLDSFMHRTHNSKRFWSEQLSAAAPKPSKAVASPLLPAPPYSLPPLLHLRRDRACRPTKEEHLHLCEECSEKGSWSVTALLAAHGK